MKKQYITAEQLLHDAFRLAEVILDSEFTPTFIVALWRGGTPIGIAIQEVLALCGKDCNHTAIRASSYQGINQQDAHIRIYGLSILLDSLTNEDRVLIVDDIHDSGRTCQELIHQIKEQSNTAAIPVEIKTATVYYKPKQNAVAFKPDFYLYQTDDWIVFPHELAGLSKEEILEQKPGIEAIKPLLRNYLK